MLLRYTVHAVTESAYRDQRALTADILTAVSALEEATQFVAANAAQFPQGLAVVDHELETIDFGGSRGQEAPRPWRRRARYFARDGRWWFLTRENIEVGPFDSRFDAEVACRQLVRALRKVDDAAKAHLAVRRFMLQLQKRTTG
jgi:hypothetical protein